MLPFHHITAAPSPPFVPAMQYLFTYTPPTVPLCASRINVPPKWTESEYFNYRDIPVHPPHWPDFAGTEIIKEFKKELSTPVFVSAVQCSPLRKVRNEQGVTEAAVRTVFPQVNRALHALSNMPSGNHRYLIIQDITGGGVENGVNSDRAGVVDNTDELRTVGEIKPSYNFKSTWLHLDPTDVRHRTVRQVLSQLHWYMWQAGCRYGYVMTDLELLVVMRPGKVYGDVHLAESIQWGASSLNPWPPVNGLVANVALGLWAVHMRAARDNEEWTAPRPPRLPSPSTTQSSLQDDGSDYVMDGNSDSKNQDEDEGLDDMADDGYVDD